MKVRRGYTLVEVVVAMLLSAVMITSVFTLALSNKSSGLRADSQVLASASTQSVAKLLANYVTADWTQKLIPGPNSLNTDGVSCPPTCATWYLNSAQLTDSRGNVWALAPGSHTITGNGTNEGLLPRLSGYTGSVTYCVQWNLPAGSCTQCTNNTNCSAGTCTAPLAETCQPSITVRADWTPP
jgi:prepilin-type N-terminal cleavage/methylation domain-containing protein